MPWVAVIIVVTLIALYVVWAQPWAKKAPASRPAAKRTSTPDADTADERPKSSRPPERRSSNPPDEEVTMMGQIPAGALRAPAVPKSSDELALVGGKMQPKGSPARHDSGPPLGGDDVTVVGAVPKELLAAIRGEAAQTTRPPPPADEEPDIDVDGPPDSEPTGPQAMIFVTGVARSDTGKRRASNEDSYLALQDHALYVVADGMGGYAGGDLASSTACEVMSRAFATGKFEGRKVAARPRRGDELVRAIEMANGAVFAKASADPELTGMGTTVVAARFSPNKKRMYYAHVGDSRLYRMRNEELRQMTRDHTIGEATGATGPLAARLTRAVGIGPEVDVDLGSDEPETGDVYLICSDGLTKMLRDTEIREVLASEKDLGKAAQRLVDAANEHGGRDNVTVVLVRVDKPLAGAAMRADAALAACARPYGLDGGARSA